MFSFSDTGSTQYCHVLTRSFPSRPSSDLIAGTIAVLVERIGGHDRERALEVFAAEDRNAPVDERRVLDVAEHFVERVAGRHHRLDRIAERQRDRRQRDVPRVRCVQRSEERGVGIECVRTCSSRWWTHREKNKKLVTNIATHMYNSFL